jgi:flagellar motor switch protein FliN/FliY
MNESIATFFDALTGELQRLLSPDQLQQVTVSWNRGQSDLESLELVWFSCTLSVDPACRIYAAADPETWKELGGADGADSRALTQSIQHAAKARFGSLVSCTDLGTSEEKPSAEWARVPVEIVREPDSGLVMYLVLSPGLTAALEGVEETSPSAPARNVAANQLDILQHVEVPVSVSFGRTHMLLKDLLGLAHGSVVQLNRELGDEVEIRVNNCVIARGEVVAVEGNYGVRILAMASSPSGQGVRGALGAG